MSPRVVVVIDEDPVKTHRPVEALRIALGLSTGNNPLTVVLLGRAPLLLTEEISDILDAEILEKYLPSFKQLQIPLVVPLGAHTQFAFDSGFDIRESSSRDIEALVTSSDRVFLF